MTALERLRKLAHEMPDDNVWTGMLRSNLLDICHDIEREQDALVKDSPYDALPPDDRDVIAWVRELGGIEELRRMFQDADNRRVELCGALGIDLDKGWSEAMAAMRPRLMPEGMEWPRFEDGEPVRIGDEYVDTFGANTVATIEFGDGYSAINPGTPGGYVVGEFEGAHGRHVPRPAPKVLDAVGVEIRVGDEVWDVDGSGPFIVSGFVGEPLAVIFEIAECNDLPRKPSQLTHRAPVLAADGRPLREGETVYKVVGDGTAYVFDGMSDNVDGLAMLHHHGKPYIGTGLRVDQLTHERPDSWERIEADCMQDAKDYCEEHGIEPEYPKHIGKAKCEDLVRRAKALAERDAS